MEVKINREIREYTEAMFFGLSLRQFFFSALACIVAVAAYFLLRPYLGMETVSWVCILVAAPFAVIGEGEKQMIKTLKTTFKQDRESFEIPKGVQDIVSSMKMGSFRWEKISFPARTSLMISIIMSLPKRIRKRCFWNTRSF